MAAMARDNDAVLIDQNRNDKSERRDAVGNLTDLLARMGARVATVGRELVDRSPTDINHKLLLLTPRPSARASTCVGYRPNCSRSSGSDHIHADRIALLLALTARADCQPFCAACGSRLRRGACPAGIARRPEFAVSFIMTRSPAFPRAVMKTKFPPINSCSPHPF